MTTREINECKNFAKQHGFNLIEKYIYLDNNEKWFYLLAAFYDHNIWMHKIRFDGDSIRCGMRAEEIKTVEEFKNKLLSNMKRWKECKLKQKMNKMEEDFK